EHDIRELLVLTLGRMGLRTDTAPNLTAARQMLGTVDYDLCLTDMRLPDGSGLELVSEIATRFPHTPVAVITAYGNVEAAVEALKAGAFDFVSKPVDVHMLRGLVRQALELGQRQQEPEESSRLNGEAAVEALKGGAFDLVSRPVDGRRLRGLVCKAGGLGQRRQEPEESSRLFGETEAMITWRRTIAKVARSQAPVHISGESGTGQ